MEHSLADLNTRWSECSACGLGISRRARNGSYIPGVGVKRGIMFIGSGPNEDDEYVGRPFSGAKNLVDMAIRKHGIEDYYLTNLVGCRSCHPAVSKNGEAIMTVDGYGNQVQQVRDEIPLPTEMAACKERILNEIWLVDPIVIVMMGAEVVKTLTGKIVTVYSPSNEPIDIMVPGIWEEPVLTEKKQAWGRKVKGSYIYPTRPMPVKYIGIPTMNPEFVMGRISSSLPGNPREVWDRHIAKALRIYNTLIQEANV